MSCASYELQSHSEIEPTEERPRIKSKISLFFHQEKFCREATFIWPRSTSKPLGFKDDPQVEHLCIATQETNKQTVAKLKQDYMDITGYLHYARALEVETRLHGHYWLSPLCKSFEGWLESPNQTA